MYIAGIEINMSVSDRERYVLPSLRYLRKRTLVLSGIYVLFIIFYLGMASYHEIQAYVAGEGFDVTSTQAVIIGLWFVFIVAAGLYFIRRPLMVLATYRRARKGVIVPEFDMPLDPIEASVMIDAVNEGELRDIMLHRLEAAGCIGLVSDTGGNEYVMFTGERPAQSHYDTVFYDCLRLWRPSEGGLPLGSQAVKDSVRVLEDVICDSLAQRGLIRVMSVYETNINKVWRALSWIAVIMSMPLMINALDPTMYSIGYPRYPMELWQLIPAVGMLATMIAVPLFIYFRSHGFTSNGEKAHRQAMGMYIFLKQAYTDRLKTGALSAREMQRLRPYALAFGMELPKYRNRSVVK